MKQIKSIKLLVIATQTTSLYKAGIFSNLHFAGESQCMTMPMLAGVVLGENQTSENVNRLKKLVKITEKNIERASKYAALA